MTELGTPPQSSAPAAPLAGLSAVKLAVLARRARAQGDALLRADPIAIVGMACRFPGGADAPQRYWELLIEGRDAIGPVPPQRWDAEASFDANPAAPGKSAVREGGFIGDVDGFDAGFFGILPREAEKMDPQQRLFLEVATEALDEAGLTRERLAGSRTGVFAACYHSDYAQLQYRDIEDIDARTLTGTVHSVVSNRLSYLLDLRGPSITIDTACSSSLVALHLACQSLRYGECDAAITGGVSLMLTPELMVSLSKVGFMAPDGRCKTFDDAADGFGRGEGCGVIVLKRLADAIADGDRVLALVRGSAVNQDGHSTVLAAPNGLAQREVIRQALDNAQVPAHSIGYVEAHGTGTPLGDPIEMEALADTIGVAAADAGPCYVGAAKANIGHMEAAAGIGGVIKSILMFQHGVVPPQVHFRKLSRHIRLDGTRLKIPAVAVPWPRGAQPRRIATSGFGVGGTNAHVLLEEAPQLPSPVATVAPDHAGAQLLPLSAQSEPALRVLASAWVELLARSTGSAAALCAAASLRRSHLDHRLAVVGASTQQLAERLRGHLEGPQGAQVATGHRAQARQRLGFVFSGQGPQWFAMGRELLAEEPVFRDKMHQIDALLAPLSGWSLRDALAAEESASRLHETLYAQPALFALQVALSALWKSWGIEPDGVVGHSIGELAALHVAGVLPLPEAVRIVWLRASAMQRAGAGAMAAVALDKQEAATLLATQGDALSIGAINAPRGVVLSGDAIALTTVLAQLQARGVASRRLPVQYAFHSAQMQPLAQSFAAAIGEVTMQAPLLPFYSTVSGARAVDGFDAGYFSGNVRRPVRFAAAIGAMLEDGFDAFLEIGPHPVLGMSIAECAAGREVPPLLLASLRRQRPERETLLQACAALFIAQRLPRWPAINPARPADVPLPAYPWQRRRYWLRAPPQAKAVPGELASGCLGRRLPAGAATIFESSWPDQAPAWLADHRVGARLLVPAAAMLESLRQAAVDALGSAAAVVREFIVHRPLVLAEEGATTRWQVSASHDGQLRLQLHEQLPAGGAAAWQLVASAVAEVGSAQNEVDALASEVPAFDAAATDAFYEAFDSLGVQFGPAFRTVRGLVAEAALARASLELRTPAVGMHPALLDGALQACIAAATGTAGRVTELLLPIGVDRYQVHGEVPPRLRAEVAWRREGVGGSITAQVRLCAVDGRVVAQAQGVRLAPANLDSLLQPRADDWLYEVTWEPVARAAKPRLPAAWILVVDEQHAAEPLAATLRNAGSACACLHAPELAGLDVLLADATWRRGLPLAGVVLLTSLNVPVAFASDAASGTDNERIDALVSQAALRVYQSMARSGLVDAQLVFVTSGAQPAGGSTPRPAGAGLWGMQAAIVAEQPDFACRVIDIDADALPVDVAALAAEILDADRTPRVALRGTRRLRPRLRGLPAPAMRPPQLCLQRDATGLLDALAWKPLVPAAPGPGEVRLRVVAAGLNFRDVLLALGMYPGDTTLPLGAECAGVVETVGAGVSHCAPGDVVFGFAPRSLATTVNVPAACLAPLPRGLSPEQAAALPVAFLTAMYGLQHVAALRAGMSVLIHAAAGGVGMAAVQLALRAGATVFATAGSPAKRELLRAQGVQHVFDSRSLDFAVQLRAATAGRGVDVVLNSLAGEFIGASVESLSATGCFLELGKRDLWSTERFAALRPRARYVVYDLGELVLADARLLPPMLAGLCAALEAGTLRPLPLRVFDFEAAQDAFRFMAQARHVGKLVLRAPAAGDARTSPPHADGTYLITGGLGAIGRQTALWLARQGARHLVLISRRAPDADAAKVLRECRQLGASIEVRHVDVGDFAAMRGLLHEIARTMPPLRGVVHAAGVVDDGVLLQQDATRFAAVLRGKAHGARHLHALTRDARLDFFILYSAAGLLLGPAGQGAYAAANAELDALAWSRRAAGLPATSVAWGMWRDGGMAAAMAARGADGWSARGLAWIAPEQGFAKLQQLLERAVPHAAVLPIDWTRFFATAGTALDRDWFAGLGAPARSAVAAAARAPSSDLVAGWRAAPRGQLRTLVIAHLREQSLQVLGLDPAAALDDSTPLKDAGLDSLMAVELRNALTRSVCRSLPATLLFDYPTLEKLAEYLLRVLELAAPAVVAVDTAAASLAAMSEAQAEALLLAELQGGSPGPR